MVQAFMPDKEALFEQWKILWSRFVLRLLLANVMGLVDVVWYRYWDGCNVWFLRVQQIVAVHFNPETQLGLHSLAIHYIE